MDCFAVSVCEGLILKEDKYKYSYIIGLSFGFFQGLMFLLGFMIGKEIIFLFEKFTQIFGFILLSAVGIKMILDAKKDEKEHLTKNFKKLIIISIATSVDALGVGLGLSLVNTNYMISSIIIGIVTFFVSFIGARIGEKAAKFTTNAEIYGGLILIIIGLKILFGWNN